MAEIDKLQAAGRQLDTALDLFFANADSLSVHTLAFASFKILFDLYPHRRDDGFDRQLDELILKDGWQPFSKVANFLKHADRDPDGCLKAHYPEQAEAIIGFATLLYRRLNGSFTLKMEAFDCWTETVAADALGIAEVDENVERAARNKRLLDGLAAMPHEQRIGYGKRFYNFYQAHGPALKAAIQADQQLGLSVTEMLDKQPAT